MLEEVLKILDKYGSTGKDGFLTIVGVYTGALKASIRYDVFKSKLRLRYKWLWYGQFINPWKRKTGMTDKPGYWKVLNDTYLGGLKSEIVEVLKKETIKTIKNIQ